MQSPPSESSKSVSDVSGTSSHHVRNPRSHLIYSDVELDTDVETPEPAAKAPEPVVQSTQPTALPPSPVKSSPVQQSAPAIVTTLTKVISTPPKAVSTPLKPSEDVAMETAELHVASPVKSPVQDSQATVTVTPRSQKSVTKYTGSTKKRSHLVVLSVILCVYRMAHANLRTFTKHVLTLYEYTFDGMHVPTGASSPP